MNFSDGTPYELKGSCTVWVGGKDGDYIKVLPIDIGWHAQYEPHRLGDHPREFMDGLAYRTGQTIKI
jgi:hypothetical protein